MAKKKVRGKVVKVQVPVRESLKDLADEKALEIGFGSIQEVIRLFLAGFVRDEYAISFSTKNGTRTKGLDDK